MKNQKIENVTLLEYENGVRTVFDGDKMAMFAVKKDGSMGAIIYSELNPFSKENPGGVIVEMYKNQGVPLSKLNINLDGVRVIENIVPPKKSRWQLLNKIKSFF